MTNYSEDEEKFIIMINFYKFKDFPLINFDAIALRKVANLSYDDTEDLLETLKLTGEIKDYDINRYEFTVYFCDPPYENKINAFLSKNKL